MSLICVVDDIRTLYRSGDQVIHLRDSKRALAYLAQNWTEQQSSYGWQKINELYLDWDLGKKDTTEPVAKFLWALSYHAMAPLDIGQIYIITENPVGAKILKDMLCTEYDLITGAHINQPVKGLRI